MVSSRGRRGRGQAGARARRLAVAVLALASAAGAQTYLFEVPREIIAVAVNADSSLDIDYQITFRNSASADAIDIVDVGFPTEDYDLNSVVAEIDGHRLYTVRPSEYVDIGVEIPLGEYAIPPGGTGTLHVYGRNYHMVFADDADEAFASCVFSPSWFGEDYTLGSTHLTMEFIFPPGVSGDYTRWHDDQGGQPGQTFVGDGRVHYVWDWPSASPSAQYYFGVSFPRDAVTEVRTKPRFKWLTDILGGLVALATQFCGCLIPISIFVAITAFSVINRRRRRMKYLPPRAKVEGVGIKRGLTAPEAALILETPLNKVLTLILFGLLKKGAVAVTSQDPFKLKKLPIKENGFRPYERDFLAAVKEDGELDEAKLRPMVVDMIKAVEQKMKGFSHRETVAYYRKIVETAWRLVNEAATPELKAEEFTNSLEWTMLDGNFEGQTREIFTGYVIPTPYWWGRFVPAGGPAAGGGAGGINVPTLPGASFANAVVSRVEGVAHNIVSKVESFTGRVTSVTNPPPVTRSGGFGGGGSGGGCACACACAGCACACAGGGR